MKHAWWHTNANAMMPIAGKKFESMNRSSFSSAVRGRTVSLDGPGALAITTQMMKMTESRDMADVFASTAMFFKAASGRTGNTAGDEGVAAAECA